MVRDTHLWRPARVLENVSVADGSMWLTLEASDGMPAAFDPGHVLGLGIEVEGHLMRHAYTVSRGDAAKGQFAHLYRVIPDGRLTPRLSKLKPGATMYFHGPFHTPIHLEVHGDVSRIFLIGTGTGVGPLFGYAEKALAEGESRPMKLITSFRRESDMCLRERLTELATRHPNFTWTFSLTRPSDTWTGLTGRVTDRMPELIDKHELDVCHFHLVGNGEMVHLVRKALHRAGLSPGRVSIETYFNHHVEPNKEEVEDLAQRLLS